MADSTYKQNADVDQFIQGKGSVPFLGTQPSMASLEFHQQQSSNFGTSEETGAFMDASSHASIQHKNGKGQRLAVQSQTRRFANLSVPSTAEQMLIGSTADHSPPDSNQHSGLNTPAHELQNQFAFGSVRDGSMISLDDAAYHQKRSAFDKRMSVQPHYDNKLSPSGKQSAGMRLTRGGTKIDDLISPKSNMPVELPSINGHRESPLVGFTDLSITKQRIQKAIKRHADSSSNHPGFTVTDPSMDSGRRSSIQPISNMKKQTPAIMLDSLRKNRDLITLLSPRQNEAPSPGTLLSPHKVAAKHQIHALASQRKDPSQSPSPRRGDDMGITFGGDLGQGDDSLGAGLKMPNKKKVKDSVGKSLADGLLPGDTKKLKKTRFSLDGYKADMPGEVMEQWVDKCLAKDKDIQKEISLKKFSKEDMRTATKKYGVSKAQLQALGMAPEYITRIQRGLFVHSMGFYELVREAARTCENSAMITINIWTVYSKLLEACCQTDHKLLMMELTEGLTKEIEVVKDACEQKLSGFAETEAILHQNLNTAENKIEVVTVKLKAAEIDNQENSAHIKSMQSQAESNTETRIVIEKRLNEQLTMKRKDDFHRAELTEQLKTKEVAYKKIVVEHEDLSVDLKKMTLAWEIAAKEGEIANKTIESSRKELSSKLINLRECKIEIEQNKKQILKLTEDLEKNITLCNEAVRKYELHETVLKSTHDDRDRYQTLYQEEYKLRTHLEEKGDSNTQLLYETQKELAERRTRMGFTDNIIAGKDKKLEELDVLMKARAVDYEDLETQYANLVDQKKALDDSIAFHKQTSTEAVDNLHETTKQIQILEKQLNDEKQNNHDMALEVAEVKRKIQYIKDVEMESLNTTIGMLSATNAHQEMQAQAKETQVEHARKLRNKEFEDLNRLVIGERAETQKWKIRFQDEQKQFKAFQEKNMRNESEHYDNQKKIGELEFEILNNSSQSQIQKDAIREWQQKYLVADERIKELERQVRATRLMREKLEKVKEEKIRLVRKNMEDLNETYAKFLHQNAMTAEDVRSEALRTKDKYDKAIFEIERLNAYIEMKRIENLKKETAYRKRIENLEMTQQDFVQETLRFKKELEILETRFERKQEELNDMVHEVYRYQDTRKTKPSRNYETQTDLVIDGITLKLTGHEPKDAFTQMITNSPIPRFTGRGQQCSIKVYQEGETQCNIKGTETEAFIEEYKPQETHSLQDKIPEKKVKKSKSYDNLHDQLEIVVETMYNEFGEKLSLKKEMAIQCNPDTLAKEIEESLKNDSPGLRERYGQGGNLADQPTHSEGGTSIMYDSRGLPVSKQGSMLQNSAIQRSLKRSGLEGSDDDEEEDENNISKLLGKGVNSNSMKTLDIGQQAEFKYGQYENQPHVQSMSMLNYNIKTGAANKKAPIILKRPNQSNIRNLIKLAHLQHK